MQRAESNKVNKSQGFHKPNTMENAALQSPCKSHIEQGADPMEEHAEEPPILHKCASQPDHSTIDGINHIGEGASEDDISSAPVLSAVVAPEVDPDNALRSPPKLLPAVVMTKRKSHESSKTPFKPLSGSMKNTPASLSIIDAPSTKSVRSTRSSIDPTFAAKQRSFLNRVHNALSSVRIDDTSCDSDPEPAPGEDDEDLSNDNEYVPGYEDMPARRPSTLLNTSNKRRRDDTSFSKGKTTTSLNHINSANVLVNDKEGQEPTKKKRIIVPSPSGKDKYSDLFCWLCHREEPDVGCATCPRAYHNQCLRRTIVSNLDTEWVCPECVTILKAENQETRSKALKMLTLDQLCNLLQFAVQRMKSCSGAADFEGPVDADLVPTYHDYIVNPMHLSLLEKNIKKKCYGSTEAFVADATWLVHNSIIFNTAQSKLTSNAKNILRLCKQEMAEIENCPDCYHYSYTADDNWFVQVCHKPHVLLWAKLKGFPYWPAKAMKCNADSIDVRFFGAHDRAWVPVRDCYLYSQENPNPIAATKPQPAQSQPKKRNPRNNLDICIEEVELHIQLLKVKFSVFQYAPLKMCVDSKKLDSHLKYMLPKYDLSESSSTSPKKVILSKRRSFELKTSVPAGAAVKRMKADSSSISPASIIRLFSPCQQSAPKETDALSSVILEKSDIKMSSSPVSDKKDVSKATSKLREVQDEVRNKENGVCSSKETEDSQSRLKIDNVPVTLNTVTPGQSHTFITPLKLPESTSIEMRFKKKDARKIGLVDRIQEKISLWVSQGSISTDGSSVVSEKKSSKDFTSQDTESKKIEKDSEKVLSVTQSSCVEVCSENEKDVKVDIQEDKDSEVTRNCETKSLASVKKVPQNSVSRLLNSLQSKQPKVILKKLVLPKEDVELKNYPLKAEDAFSDDCKVEKEVSLHTQNGKKITVAEMKIVSDNEEDSELDVVLANKSKSSSAIKPSDSVTSTNPLLADASRPTAENVSSGPNQPSQEHSVEATANLVSVVNEIPIETSEEETKVEGEPTKSQTWVNKEMPGKLSQCISKVEPKEEPPSESDTEQDPALSKQSVDNPTSKSSKKKSNRSSKAVSVEVQGNKTSDDPGQSGSPQRRLKLVKSFNIRARPLSSLKDTSPRRFVPIAPKQDPCMPSDVQDANANTSDEANIEPDGSNSKGGQMNTLKSLLSKNAITVRVGKPSNLECAKSEREKSTSVPSLVESKAVASLTTAKAKTIVVKAGKSVVHIESPPKTLTSSCIVTSPSQRLIHGATSILKVKNPPESTTKVILDSSEKVQTPNLHILSGAASLPTSKKSSPPLSGSPASPKYVTVSQSLSGRPIVRRVLPAGITLSSVAKAVRVSAGKLSATTDSVPEVSEISSKAPISKEMPPLSIATVYSQQSASSIQTNAATNPEIETIVTGQPRMSASPQTFVASSEACKGPISSEFRSQANKMTDIFMGCLKDCLTEMGTQGHLEAQVRCLQLEMEQLQWRHQQEMEELRHNTELVIAEIRDRMKAETEHAVNIAVANAGKEKEAAIAAAKEKQWCAFCKKEAMFYCCWNTSYCDHRCQQGHWPVHSLTCTQNTSSVDHDHHLNSGNGQKQPAKMRRIVISHKEGLTPPLLKKC